MAAQVEFEAKFEGGSSYYSFKRLDPGAFNVGVIGSTPPLYQDALKEGVQPRQPMPGPTDKLVAVADTHDHHPRRLPGPRVVPAQVEFESKI
jgi:hypothetical protein